jgi:xylulokinase
MAEPVGAASGITVGVDIGTTSVKALAVDAAGKVLARSRVRHQVHNPEPACFEHDADRAWRRNVRRVYREVSEGLDVAAVNVAAMVPSLCAVDHRGRPTTPGLLYGDARGGEVTGKSPAESGELVEFLRWSAREAPGAFGYWPAQAVANHALCGVGAIDSVTAVTAYPLFDFTRWDPEVVGSTGASVDQLPLVVPGDQPAGTIDGTLVGGGTVDALAEQLVAGADREGDVLVILGTTLITWAVVSEWREVEGLWTVPHTAPGKTLIGGPSNAGGLFLEWTRRLIRPAPSVATEPGRAPVWLPYVRGERTPLHDPMLTASLHDLDVGHGPSEVERAAQEASGFVVRHHLDLASVEAKRIVATGGGTRVDGWVQAIADCTGLPVDVVGVPEGGALGAAYLARVIAGLEPSAAGASRWASTDRRFEPRPSWVAAASERYGRFRELTEAAAGRGAVGTG